jgi:hypothetical protein
MTFLKLLKTIFLALLAISCFFATGIASSLTWWYCGYYAELNYVKRILLHMRGVELVQAWGNEDVTLEDIGAHIKVRNKGDMTFFQLSRQSFNTGDRIIIGSIGGLEPRSKGHGYFGVYQTSTGEPTKSEYFGSSIQLNRDSHFAKEFPFKIQTVQDAIGHYDDIYRIINEWPRCPKYKTVTDSDRNVHCFCTTDDVNSSQYPSGCTS